MRIDILALASELGIARADIEARSLVACEEASVLELAEVSADGREHFLVPPAAMAWRALKAAALADGVTLHIVSAFRGIERQAEIVRRKLAAGQPIDTILRVCAPPGFSEHHTGRAVDLATPGCPPLEVEFEATPAFAWLERHAARFGFALSYPAGNAQGYLYEPWHWCFLDDAAFAPAVEPA